MEEEDQFPALSFFSALILFTPSQLVMLKLGWRPGNAAQAAEFWSLGIQIYLEVS